MKYYILSDLHGKKGSIQLIDSIVKHYNINGIDSQLIINGDCIDGGKEGIDLLYKIKQLSDSELAVMIKGNHEQMLLDWLHNNDSSWLLNDNYQHGLKRLLRDTKLSRTDYSLASRSQSIIKASHAELINWLVNLPTILELNHFIIVHAGLDFSNEDNRAWLLTTDERKLFMNPFDMLHNNSGKWVVLGHFWSSHFHDSNDIFVNVLNKQIQLDGNVLNDGQFNMLEINDTNGMFNCHNNVRELL